MRPIIRHAAKVVGWSIVTMAVYSCFIKSMLKQRALDKQKVQVVGRT